MVSRAIALSEDNNLRISRWIKNEFDPLTLASLKGIDSGNLKWREGGKKSQTIVHISPKVSSQGKALSREQMTNIC